jgi:cytochrome oxidase Cu insertion factor (SCO1/SenC/PrrC family)
VECPAEGGRGFARLCTANAADIVPGMDPKNRLVPLHRSRARGAFYRAASISISLMCTGPVLAHEPLEEQAPSDAPAQVIMATRDYHVPEVQLVRADGRSVSLREEMNDGRPVVLNFVFTSCSSVCPLMSQIFARFQQQLGGDRDKVHLMSISIDPEEDTPARLREYAQKFHAGPEWQHYTGTLEASLTVQHAFGVYRGDKMSHAVVTLMRAAPGQQWRRIEGLVTPDELLAEYRALLNAPHESVASR